MKYSSMTDNDGKQEGSRVHLGTVQLVTDQLATPNSLHTQLATAQLATAQLATHPTRRTLTKTKIGIYYQE